MSKSAGRPFFGGNGAGRTAKLLAVLLALLLWEAAALLLGNEVLLVTPVRVLGRLWELMGTADFWATLGFSFTRIVGGFLLALTLGSALAVLAGRAPLLETLLWPYVAAVKAVPVASFIILALLWLSAERLSLFISFLMVFPVIYTNILQGIHSADGRLLEMAALYRVPWPRRLRYIYLPALRPYLTAGCSVALGMCWKAGVAAEVIAVTQRSVGGRLYDAKVYLEIPDLFAWTAVVVAVSVLFEKLFLRLLRALFERMEAV